MHAPVDADEKNTEKKSRLDEINAAFSVNAVGDDDGCIFTQAFVDEMTKMPEIDSEFTYLLEWINEVGYFNSNGMGAVTIGFLEIKAWADLMQTNPTPSDVRILRSMSQAFISHQEKSKKLDTIDPLLEL